MTVTEDIETGHQDRVTALHINFDGSKILTASVDHRVKVWNVDRTNGERQLIDTWTAHDADIRDAKWLHPSTGTHLATIGNDLKFHLWQEDPYQAPHSGRRFRKIHTILSKPRVPFVSFDLKNIDNVYTYLALIDRQGMLSIYEPTNPDEFKDWTLVDQFNVVNPAPGRGDLSCFRVRFDQNITPLPYINCLSDDKRQLSLIATALNEVKIYRSVATTNTETAAVIDSGGLPSSAREASHRFMFYEAVRLPTHPALVRDVQWAPFNVRGHDLLATACKDGAVRIFEMSVTENKEHGRGSGPHKDSSAANQLQTNRSAPAIIRQPSQYSSLTSAITSRNQTTTQNPNTNQNQGSNAPQTNPANTNTPDPGNTNFATVGSKSPNRNTYHFPYAHNIVPVANLTTAHEDAWSITWDPSGQVLMSGGADGATKIWRRSILDSYQQSQGEDDAEEETVGRGRWMLFADQSVELGPETREGSEIGSDVE